CDAEVLDTTDPTAPVRRTIPKRVADRVDARDRRRCRVPGCPNRGWIERHHEHEDGWRGGHDLDRILLLCSGHHDARHRGHIRIEGRGREMRFFLADGTPIEDARASARVSAVATAACS